MDENQFPRSVQCGDFAGRPSEVTVNAEPGVIFLVAPPGEIAKIAPTEIEDLKKALTDALVIALRGDDAS